VRHLGPVGPGFLAVAPHTHRFDYVSGLFSGAVSFGGVPPSGEAGSAVLVGFDPESHEYPVSLLIEVTLADLIRCVLVAETGEFLV
jgi:hypothetical protein